MKCYVIIRHGLGDDFTIVKCFKNEIDADVYILTSIDGPHSEIHRYTVEEVEFE